MNIIIYIWASERGRNNTPSGIYLVKCLQASMIGHAYLILDVCQLSTSELVTAATFTINIKNISFRAWFHLADFKHLSLDKNGRALEMSISLYFKWEFRCGHLHCKYTCRFDQNTFVQVNAPWEFAFGEKEDKFI